MCRPPNAKAKRGFMTTLRIGDSGAEVKMLQQSLAKRGFDPGIADGEFGAGTEAAVVAFQKSENLVPDGVAGPRTQAKLSLISTPVLPDITASVTVAKVVKMFPGTAIGNISAHLPSVLSELSAAGIGDRLMVLAALATIRAETAQFLPISEFVSVFNTSPNGHHFDLYDNRKDLGNRGRPDGDDFKGRGFIQLTGRANYERIGNQIGQNLVTKPALCNEPDTAARILAAFLKNKEFEIKTALVMRDFLTARRAVNGGSHGLKEFTKTYLAGEVELP